MKYTPSQQVDIASSLLEYIQKMTLFDRTLLAKSKTVKVSKLLYTTTWCVFITSRSFCGGRVRLLAYIIVGTNR